ncbi:hypothetical protein AVEN_75211-1, partial [Araneus ventricosus]
SFLLAILNGLSGIAIRFQFRGRRAPGSKPDSPEDPPCLMSPPLVRCGTLERVPAKVPSLSSDHGSK